MKKILGILGISVIAAAMFVGTNSVNTSTTDTSLAGLIAMNTANAQSEGGHVDDCDNDPNDVCYNSETGTKTINCDPSNFWDTCGD